MYTLKIISAIYFITKQFIVHIYIYIYIYISYFKLIATRHELTS